MNVTLISNHDNLIKAVTAGQYIIEYYAVPERTDLVSMQIFDPKENTISEIEPDISKIRFIEIINCIWNCGDVYFAACDVTENSKLNISIFRYSTKDHKSVMICSFIKNRDLLNEDKRMKLFILSDSTILMQTEILHRSVSQNMMGNIEFSLTLYNLDSGTETAVSEANFINNGINTVIPVSEKKILVKTGYSYIEDSRLDTGSKNESFIESIYLTTVAKFIADITLEKEIVDMPMIESAYLDRHITKPFVDGDYTHFTIIDAERKITKCVFFHNETEERTEYSIASFDPEDLYITHVVNNIPYVRSLAPGVSVVVFRLYGRKQGLIVQEGNPKNLTTWGALLREGVRISNRAKGCGARVLLDEKLRAMDARVESIEGYDSQVQVASAAVRRVSAGLADVAIGTSREARRTKGVKFVPLQIEWIDLVVTKTPKTRSYIRELSSLLTDERFRWDTQTLGPGDLSNMGSVVYES